MKKNRLALPMLAILLLLLSVPSAALAQTYSFQLSKEVVNVFWNEDGTQSIDYVFTFANDPSAGNIEFVDLGLPNSSFDLSSISADVDGKPVTDISESGYQGKGSGVAVGLGPYSIPPGQTGTVHIFVGTVSRLLHQDNKDSSYASAVFAPNYFGPEFVHGKTDLSVSFHLPPGVKPDEPRWHASPSGWPSQPDTGIDDQGRVVYTWSNPQASGDTSYPFGASFPKKYVPASAILQPTIWELLGVDPEVLTGFLFCGGFAAFIVLVIVLGVKSAQKRKLQYLPPRVAIEGHGIKRGLTSIEAAILLEEPMDKVLTMILFAVIKKNAASVVTREPLKLQVASPLPEGLNPYETGFLSAFQKPSAKEQRQEMQNMMVALVQSVSQKMKGFSRGETIAYYRDIMNRAWAQVEAANTPDVKSAKYDEVMEWTMLDKNYAGRTQDVFRGGPVFVPVWWPRYDPGFGRGTVGAPVSGPVGAPSVGGGGMALPNLPGSDFAASVVRGTQDLAGSVVGNLTDFTSKITNLTNPPPVVTASSSRGGFRGGGGCACACACAGCACACAGGGR